jgi:hypothetical protein
MPEKIPEEELKKLAGFYMDLAQGNLEDLKRSIESCDVIGAYPIFRDVHANTERARKYSSDLPAPIREEMIKNITFIEAESFETIDGILTKCSCRPRSV